MDGSGPLLVQDCESGVLAACAYGLGSFCTCSWCEFVRQEVLRLSLVGVWLLRRSVLVLYPCGKDLVAVRATGVSSARVTGSWFVRQREETWSEFVLQGRVSALGFWSLEQRLGRRSFCRSFQSEARGTG